MKLDSQKAVSIIVPVYNVEQYLSRCVESILQQSFTNYEIMLINDGSSDNSGKICDEYAEKNSKIMVFHTNNRGVSAARNLGIENARGKYIMFVDSDDYVETEMLEDMLEHDGADCIVSGYRTVDTQNNILNDYPCMAFNAITVKEFLHNYYVNFDRKDILSGPINKLFSTEIIKRHKIRFDEELSICEDGLFVLQFLSRCKTISAIEKSYYNYVQYRVNTLMCKYNENAIEACEKRYLANLNLLKEHLISEESLYVYVKKHNYYKFLYFLLQIYTRSELTGVKKYQAMKQALRNTSFVDLIVHNNTLDVKKYIFKLLLKTRCFALLHLVLCIQSKGCTCQ